MGLLDVNALVALAWDSHVHHAAIRSWFAQNAGSGWATCSVTEAGFVRVSSNPVVLPSAISVSEARAALAALRGAPGHRFLADDVSMADADIPAMHGHRQVPDAHLLTLARRNALALVTFDRGARALGSDEEVCLLTTL